MRTTAHDYRLRALAVGGRVTTLNALRTGLFAAALWLPTLAVAAQPGATAPRAAATDPTKAASKTAAPAGAAETGAFDTESGPASVDPAAKARARALYDRGAQAYAEGRYYAAADLFLETHRIYPTPQLLFNAAKAYDRIGHLAGALAFYREYLRHSPGASDYDEVVKRVEELSLLLAERGVQQLTVISDPENAIVLLDGKAVGLTPWTGETWAGKHRVSLDLASYETAETIVELESHRAKDVTVKLTALPPPPALRAVPATSSSEQKAAVISPLTWVVLSTATACLGSALFVEMANKNREGISRTGAFFAGAGVSASVVGGVLLYVDLSPARLDDERAKSHANLELPRFGVRGSF